MTAFACTNANARSAGLAAGMRLLLTGAFGGSIQRRRGQCVRRRLFSRTRRRQGNVSNSVPWIDVEGKGWQAGGTAVALDGNGHIYDSAAGPAAAGIQIS